MSVTRYLNQSSVRSGPFALSLRPIELIAFAGVIASFFGPYLGAVGFLVCCSVAIVVALRFRLAGVPAASIAMLPSLGFDGALHFGKSFELSVVDSIVVGGTGGVSITGPLVLLTASYVSVILQGVTSKTVPSSPLFVFLYCTLGAAVLVSLFTAFLGYSSGLNRWSEGFRGILSVSGVLWGWVAVHSASSIEVKGFFNRTASFATACAFLIVLGIVDGHFYFIMTGLVAAYLPYLARTRRHGAAALALVALGIAISTATLTVLAILATSMVLSSLTVLRPMQRSWRWFSTGSLIGGLVACSLPLMFLLLPSLATSTQYEKVSPSGLAIVQHAQWKILFDRGPLWIASWDQIRSAPLFPPTGRPLVPPAVGAYTSEEWEWGSHNAALQLMRNVGVPAAIATLLVVLAVLAVTGRTAAESSIRAVRLLSCTVLGVAVSGLTTGNFMVSDVAFILWVVAGAVIGVGIQERTETTRFRWQ